MYDLAGSDDDEPISADLSPRLSAAEPQTGLSPHRCEGCLGMADDDLMGLEESEWG